MRNLLIKIQKNTLKHSEKYSKKISVPRVKIIFSVYIFSEESEAHLPFSSPVLWQQLQDAAVKVRTKTVYNNESDWVVRDAVAKLLKVRRDEPAHLRFCICIGQSRPK